MAVTKILARKGRLDVGINYVLNGDKTEERVLTAHLNCDPGRECREMLDTKRAYGKEDCVQYYHIIQSFKPWEVTPEQALEIATEFAKEHLPGYETVIGVHVDKEHIHAHILFNSVNADTGEKYHSNAQSYYQQIRAISDRLCREHGLSVIMEVGSDKAVSYIEWLRQSRGKPTFRSMLEADLRTAIEDANDLGHFFMLMEHMGYEISHGNRLGFRLRGQPRFMYPGRKNSLFTEDGIRAAIQSGMEDIEAGRRPAVIYRPPYKPFKKYPKYTGFMALYVHYLYVLGKIGQRQYLPRMTPQLRQEVMKSQCYQEQFAFLRENDIATQGDMAAFQTRTEDALATLTKQRTILNVRKKKRKKLYDALADVSALAQAKQLYEDGLSGMEAEYARYMDAVAVLEQCGIPRERLSAEKAEIYEQVAEINRQIRAERKKLALCRDILDRMPQIEHDINKIEEHAHILLTIRPLRSDGKWGPKCRKVYDLDSQGNRIPDGKGGWKNHREDTTDWNNRDNAEKWRAAWAAYANRALEAAGRPERIDHRSYERQGVDKIPSIHMGVAASQMERKGIQTEKGNVNRQIAADNKLLKELKARITRIYNWTKEQAEVEQPQGGGSLVARLYEAQAEVNRNKASYRSGRIRALQENAKLLAFLQGNGITSMEQLYEKVSAMNSAYYDLRGKIVKAERRLAVLDERLEMCAQYDRCKAVRQKLDKVKPHKREQYQQEHRTELADFEAAERFLKELKASGEAITPKAWRAEAAKLTSQKDFDYQKMRDMRDEIKAVENLRKAADRLAHGGQHQQRETER